MQCVPAYTRHELTFSEPPFRVGEIPAEPSRWVEKCHSFACLIVFLQFFFGNWERFWGSRHVFKGTHSLFGGCFGEYLQNVLGDPQRCAEAPGLEGTRSMPRVVPGTCFRRSTHRILGLSAIEFWS